MRPLTYLMMAALSAHTAHIARATGPSGPGGPSGPNGPGDPTRAAYERFGEGELAFEDGNFARAAALFGEAFALHAQPAYLFNRAIAFARLGRHAAAVAVLQRFHRTFPGSPRKREVDRALEEALAATASGPRVEVGAVNEANASSWRAALRDEAVPELADLACQVPCALIADPGPTTVVVSDGLAARSGSRDLEAGEVWRFDPELGASPSTASWVAFSVGAAGLVTGAIFGVMALDAEREGEELVAGPRTLAAEDRLATLRGRVDDYALVADLGFALAITGATLGLVFMATSDDPQPEGLTWRF